MGIDHQPERDALLASLLCCPDCELPLNARLVCTACGRQFAPQADGIVSALPTAMAAAQKSKDEIREIIDGGAQDSAQQVVLYERAFHDEQAAYYDKLFADPLPLSTYYHRLVKDQIHHHLRGHKAVVDLCCGTGKSSLPLAERGITVVAMDVSREMLRAYQAKCRRAGLGNVIFVHADASHPPLRNGSCTALTMIGGLHHIPDKGRCLNRCCESLAPGGLLILHEPLQTGRTSKASAILQNIYAITNPARMMRALRRRLGLGSGVAAAPAAAAPADFTPYETPFSSLTELREIIPSPMRPLEIRSQGVLSFHEFEPQFQNALGRLLARLIVTLDHWLSGRQGQQGNGSAVFAVVRKTAN